MPLSMRELEPANIICTFVCVVMWCVGVSVHVCKSTHVHAYAGEFEMYIPRNRVQRLSVIQIHTAESWYDLAAYWIPSSSQASPTNTPK